MIPGLRWARSIPILASPSFVLLLMTSVASAQATAPSESDDAEHPESTLPDGDAAPDAIPRPRNYHVAPRSFGTRVESEPPPYVRTLSDTEFEALRAVDWLDVGLDFRSRFEYHENDFTRPVDARDFPVLVRTRAYLGLRRVIDPLQFAVEIEDARRYNGSFPLDDKDVNVVEPIQLFGELYFDRAFGVDLPLSVRLGRMAFEQVDRRLVARNGWRNTTNTFQGARVVIGRQSSPVQIDAFALQPLERRLYQLDRPQSGQWFFGVVTNIRLWSPHVTFQPYYFSVRQLPREGATEREIHSPALRAYGLIGDTGLDYDASGVVQFGENQGLAHQAFGFTGELGYTARPLWNMRLSATYAHATGDRDPDDQTSGRLDRMFGFARPFSNNIYFSWENLRAAKARIEIEPHSVLRADAGYGAYWLDSPTDRWNAPSLRDPTGASGRFLGHELDVRLSARILPQVNLSAGYAFFASGEFPINQGRARSTHFTYLELIVRAFS